jgi:hypothetical protein
MPEVVFNLTDVDFLQEGLNFSDIDPVQFENLVFHLIDEMGFSNLHWRKGGEGNSATDGGRDLEATFWSVQPSGAKEQKYWFEVKYRTGQLEKLQVQSTILNAAGNHSKDNIVIVTNKTISNPTLDWVNDFQSTHKVPTITIWQGHDLELLLRKNPRTLARFLPTSLAFTGRCKVVESKFSNLLLLPSGGELCELWEYRDQYYNNSFLTLGACLAEVSYGDVIARPWGMVLDKERLIATFATGMINVYPFVFRCSSLNREQAPIINGMSYLLQCLLVRCGAEAAFKIITDPENLFELNYELPYELKFNRYEPILGIMLHDLAMYCSSKYCLKLHYKEPKDETDYFMRFLNPRYNKEDRDRFLVMNSSKQKCNLGLVREDEYCPLAEDVPKDADGLIKILNLVRSVIFSRAGELYE